jgi:hypothetical protein
MVVTAEILCRHGRDPQTCDAHSCAQRRVRRAYCHMCRAYFEAPHTCQTIAALQDRQRRFEDLG